MNIKRLLAQEQRERKGRPIKRLSALGFKTQVVPFACHPSPCFVSSLADVPSFLVVFLLLVSVFPFFSGETGNKCVTSPTKGLAEAIFSHLRHSSTLVLPGLRCIEK